MTFSKIAEDPGDPEMSVTHCVR